MVIENKGCFKHDYLMFFFLYSEIQNILLEYTYMSEVTTKPCDSLVIVAIVYARVYKNTISLH